jgi:enoyl-CoA hydratase/carnithine racemase
MLGGERFGPEEARAAGLVDAVVAPEDLLPESRRIASALCEAAPQAQAAVKELLENVPGMGLDAALDYAVDMIARLRAGPEAQKGMRCFLEKKPCAWN